MRKLTITIRWDGEQYTYELDKNGTIDCDDARDLIKNVAAEVKDFTKAAESD